MHRSAVFVGLLALFFPEFAHGSVVRKLSPDELVSDADAVVEGRVVAVESRWNGDHTGLETRIRVAVEATLHGRTPPTVEIVQPGGTIAGDRHIIPGMPGFAVGEEVRLHLREIPGVRYRVYGWNQGKWLARVSADGKKTFAPAPLPGARSDGGVVFYTHNGMVWPENKIPVEYLIHQDGSDDMPLADAEAAIHAAFATWENVPCSSLSFTYSGYTDLQPAIDGFNVMLWIEADWIYGDEAAAATSLWIPIEEERTADVAFNGVGFSWAVAPEAAISYATLDVQAVLTHELGHFSGLSHTDSSVDTMYFSWRPWPGQRSLSADDKLGLCALYPVLADECQDSGDCPDDEPCLPHDYGNLCTTPADPIGAACSYERIECEGFCLFTSADLSTGYCSRFCEVEEDCPDGFRCADASAGMQTVRVCFVEPPMPMPDAGPGPNTCAVDSECPMGQYCGSESECTYDCIIEIDCPSGEQCSDRGQCLTGSDRGGCGCRTPGTDPGWLLCLAVLALLLHRRRKDSVTI